MEPVVTVMLWSLLAFEAKHFICDFVLQTAYQYRNKGIYGHPGGLLHAGIHVALTPLAYLVLVPGSLLVAAAIALSEFVLHYHVDWLKEQITHRNGLTAHDRGFWYALGTDQLILHFQPKLDLATGRVDDVEALVRWMHPERGLLGPGAFVPLAEQTGVMRELTEHVLDALHVTGFIHVESREVSGPHVGEFAPIASADGQRVQGDGNAAVIV